MPLPIIIASFGGQKVLVCYSVKNPFEAMSLEIKLNTVQGNVITLDVPKKATVRELKSMLLERHPCQDPIERKILKVELLHNSSIIDATEALDSATFLGSAPLVTVVYRRNEVEAATQHDTYTQAEEFFGVRIPCNVTKISNDASFPHNPRVCDSHWGLCL